ncbi:hypothetical protein HH682_00125 [Rosenbergiella sp. S61]|uniref:Uncharacterized protein n=1 Tax=Rosenbergiella gaditana TaxID=2726987 RepID=A0ABS5SSQ1_9GAMM|nr:hypothetical protein [Rosenbergiella gaditana]MBT0722871.1 hypothetical protein [Rosenbergiella gaditana]
MTVVIQYAQTVKVCLEEVKGFLVKTNQDPKAVIVGVIEGFEAQILPAKGCSFECFY